MDSSLWVLCFVFLGVPCVTKCQGRNASTLNFEDNPASTQQEVEQMMSRTRLNSLKDRIDKNKDEQLSFDELLGHALEAQRNSSRKEANEILKELDVDNDGKLSLSEIEGDVEEGVHDENEKVQREKMRKHESARFALADKDGDSGLSLEELPAFFHAEDDGVLEMQAQITLDARDADQDGQLSMDEFFSHEAVSGQDHANNEDDKRTFNRLDTDSSGLLNISELKVWENGLHHTQEAIHKMMLIADKDKDLHITIEEIEQFKGQIAASDMFDHLREWGNDEL